MHVSSPSLQLKEPSMAAEYREPLLKKKHYKNCPGCKVDEMKELEQGLPIRPLLSIWIIVLCTVYVSKKLMIVH
ncbi:hypothetical protein GOBAR_DD32217 [Gossypium barbadense]|nr:hypothetical protein GOBAR_DD32217 [Gossypium barbadense]